METEKNFYFKKNKSIRKNNVLFQKFKLVLL